MYVKSLCWSCDLQTVFGLTYFKSTCPKFINIERESWNELQTTKKISDMLTIKTCLAVIKLLWNQNERINKYCNKELLCISVQWPRSSWESFTGSFANKHSWRGASEQNWKWLFIIWHDLVYKHFTFRKVRLSARLTLPWVQPPI